MLINNLIQATYFQKLETSLHITVLYRHSTFEADGVDRTKKEPNKVTENFIVISPDDRHDHHFTHEAQKLVTDYLLSFDCFYVLHKVTDGCSCQYKSCHCLSVR